MKKKTTAQKARKRKFKAKRKAEKMRRTDVNQAAASVVKEVSKEST